MPGAGGAGLPPRDVEPPSGLAGLISTVTGWPPIALLIGTVQDWLSAGGPRLAAAIAYFTALSLAPLAVISLALAGLIVGPQLAQQELEGQLIESLGPDAAAVVIGLIATADQPGLGSLAAAIGVVTLLFAAGGLVGQLQESFDLVFQVNPPDQGIMGLVIGKIVSILLVGLAGGALILSILASSLLGVAQELLPGDGFGAWQITEGLMSLLITALVFILAFRLLPHHATGWRALALGGIVTALLFTLGKYGITVYIGIVALGSAYGTAASFVVLLVWIFYTAQIVLLGAAFTRRLDVAFKTATPTTGRLDAEDVAAHGGSGRSRGIALTIALFVGIAVGRLLPRR